MKKLLQINITANWGSHGRIAEEIGELAMNKGWKSYIAYGRYANPSNSTLIHVGNMWDERIHGLQTRLFDNHGLASYHSTKKLIREIDDINPDVIHLHNLHGYYINYPLLFEYLHSRNTPVVWTLHDCWTFTGHCTHFLVSGCEKWKTGCYECCAKKEYPTSYFLDQSKRNYMLKKKYFTSINNLVLVPVSDWLSDLLKESFWKNHVIKRIYNGIDINVFRRYEEAKSKLHTVGHVIIAVASGWTERKGLFDIFKLRNILAEDYTIIVVGMNSSQVKNLPSGIIGIERTNSVKELAQYYSAADVFINPTYQDNFPTTNLEALACGTPVVTYRTGGSPEAIDDSCGAVVDVGNVDQLAITIKRVCESTDYMTRLACRKRVELLYNKNDRYLEYIQLYNELVK